MYAFEERNTSLVTIPEDESNPELLNPRQQGTAKMESSSLFVARQQQHDERGILLSRRLRRMKRKLFLEAVGEEYIASTTRGAPLRTLSTCSSADSTEGN